MKWARVLVVAALAGSATLLGLLPRAEAARWWKLAWTLDVSVTRPKRVPVHEPGGTALYTYLTYTITNRSLREVNVVPLPVLVTDTLKTYYNQTQPVVKAIAERREAQRRLPLQQVSVFEHHAFARLPVPDQQPAAGQADQYCGSSRHQQYDGDHRSETETVGKAAGNQEHGNPRDS